MAHIIDRDSMMGSKSELDLFTVPPTQVGIERGSWVEIFPINTVTSEGPYQFRVSADPLLLDLSSNYIHMVVEVCKADGSAAAKTATNYSVSPINLFGKTFFKQVKVWLNSKLAYDSNDTYMYRAYIETLLSFGSDAKNSQLQTSLYSKDTSGKFESVENQGHKFRGAYIDDGRKMEVVGPIHADIFNQNRLMLNNMEVQLELHRNSNAFSLFSTETNADYRIKVISMTWFVRKVEILKSIALGIEARLSRQAAKYPIRRIVVRTVHVDGGRRDTPNNVLFNGQIPRRVIVGCVEKDAFFGSYSKNPFNFKPFGIRSAQVTAGDIVYPRNPAVLDFAHGLYTRAYLGLFDAINWSNADKGNAISYSDYADGYTLLGFDLSSDSADEGHWELIRAGSTSLRLEFAKDTPDGGIKVVVLAEFDNLLMIDKNRNVFFDYSV